jgi:hypothetical protein
MRSLTDIIAERQMLALGEQRSGDVQVTRDSLWRMARKTSAVALAAVLTIATGCGGSSHSRPSSSAATVGSEGTAALAADARSSATGDIPDTQNFLTLNDQRLGVAMLYPEGWTVKRTSAELSIGDKNNLVRIVLSKGAKPTIASVSAQTAALKRATPMLTASAPQIVLLQSGAAVKVTYRTRSGPNPVTGKQVTLTVDRYALGHAGRVAIVDLGTPVGVDNVDAYRRMIESFKWL